ncbi:oligosaccharide flippase family protein [Paenibacillus sp. M1]|uniref:Oligosaccharide flippase family protein n=1 Tax=Paenibacillus haidiansis TaxID=1574488 RepID=A0ABU7VVB9_9BACL
MKNPHLLLQSAIRAGAMTVVKLFGLIGRVILVRLVGAEGIGLYQMGYSLYGFLVTLFGGLPTALAIITAKKPNQGWQLLKLLSVGIIFSSGMISLAVFWEAPIIAGLLGNPGLIHALKSLAPAILAAPLLGLLRGYLQGMERFGIIAASEVIEQACRIFIMVLIIYYCLPFGIEIAVGKGLYATFLSVLISFVILTVYVSIYGAANSSRIRLSKEGVSLPMVWFFRTSLMISLTRLLVPASEFIDAILIPNRLMIAGHSPSEATSMYGVITGMAVTLVYTPSLITEALSHTMTMRIAAESQQRGGRAQTLLQLAMKLSWLWGLISGSYIFVYANELSFFLFNTGEAGQLIRYLAVIPVIVGLREMTTSILWVQDNKKIPFFGLGIGICCSIVIQYFVIAIPGYGYIGAAAGILAMELIATLWNMKEINRNVSIFKMIPLALLDTAVIICIVFAIQFADISASLTSFLATSALFFIVAGGYMLLRCKPFNVTK